MLAGLPTLTVVGVMNPTLDGHGSPLNLGDGLLTTMAPGSAMADVGTGGRVGSVAGWVVMVAAMVARTSWRGAQSMGAQAGICRPTRVAPTIWDPGDGWGSAAA